MAPFVAPRWTPKDKALPLKDEISAFHAQVTRFRDRVKGALQDFPDLADKLEETPALLESFSDKPQNLAHITDLLSFLADVQVLYEDAQRKRSETTLSTRSTSSGPAPTERGGALKVALPSHFDGSSSKARVFLAECNNFMALNKSRFDSDEIRIQWALQLCTDKAANWKRVQLELAYDIDTAPAYLVSWKLFQRNFLNKWADLNAKQKARNCFHAGLKQTGSVRRYVEAFEELILETEFHDDEMITSAFYQGLKFEVKRDLVGRRPDNLDDLKTLAITLDEERMAAQDPDRRDIKPKTTTHTSDSAHSTPRPDSASRQSTPEIKAESARIGTRLSESDRLQFRSKGRCFGCGEKGHIRPNCPQKSKAHIAAVEPAAVDPPSDIAPTREESKN